MLEIHCFVPKCTANRILPKYSNTECNHCAFESTATIFDSQHKCRNKPGPKPMSYPLYLYDILLYQLPTSIYQRALFHCLYPGRSAYLYMIYHVDISNYPSPYSREIPGTLNSGTPIPILLKYHSHKNSCMEMVWEASGKGLPLVPGEIPSIWVFPKIMVPPNHPFVHRVFHHNKPSILGVFTLFLETPIYIYILHFSY